MKVSDEVVFLEEAFDVLNQRFFESAANSGSSDHAFR